MANKRFIRPPALPIPTPALTATERIEQAERQRENVNKLAKSEYLYCLREAKRLHPEWTLAERKAYAERSAWALFD